MLISHIMKRIAIRAYCDLRLRAAAAGAFACVWWGILYPELCFTDATYVQVDAAAEQEIENEQKDCRDILQVSGDGIVIKSRLFEWIEEKIDK